MEFPTFAYHPDPLATGAVVASDTACVCCRQQRGYVYAASVYAIEEYVDCICPWCIADGSAASTLDCTFTDHDGIGGYGSWESVPMAVMDAVATRNPGFHGWQQEQWWTHCGDAAQFLGRAGHVELTSTWPGALPAIRANAGIEDDGAWEAFLRVLSADGSPTAYVFRCSHCGVLGGYQDCD